MYKVVHSKNIINDLLKQITQMYHWRNIYKFTKELPLWSFILFCDKSSYFPEPLFQLPKIKNCVNKNLCKYSK